MINNMAGRQSQAYVQICMWGGTVLQTDLTAASRIVRKFSDWSVSGPMYPWLVRNVTSWSLSADSTGKYSPCNREDLSNQNSRGETQT